MTGPLLGAPAAGAVVKPISAHHQGTCKQNAFYKCFHDISPFQNSNFYGQSGTAPTRGNPRKHVPRRLNRLARDFRMTGYIDPSQVRVSRYSLRVGAAILKE
jgi:hypothetical protein